MEEKESISAKKWFQQIREIFLKPKMPALPNCYLPPELVKRIFEIIEDHNTLLRLRLVCSQWKEVADDLLEKQRLSKWTKWETNLNLGVSNLKPHAWTVPSHYIGCESASHLVLPPLLKVKFKRNPFPQKSVAIIGFDHSHWNEKQTCPRLKYKNKVKMKIFFPVIGHFLTSVTYHDLTLSQVDLEMILKSMQNLKALTLSKVQLNNPTTPSSSSLSNLPDVPPCLVHLYLINCDILATNIFLFYCSRQLVTLKIVGLEGDLSLEQEKFPNLKNLFVYDVHGNGLVSLIQNTKVPPPLHYLSAIRSRQNTYHHDMEDLMSFISKTSATLVHLRLNVKVEALIRLLEEFRVIYPKVRLFEMALLDETNVDEVSVRKRISQWFPKLVTVKFISGHGKGWYQDRECLICADFTSDKGPAVGHISIGKRRFYSTYLPFNRS